MTAGCKAMLYDNSVRKALGALDPSSIQVDERTVPDHLRFAAVYADLIHFYDKHNRKNGTWRPFLLKDPIILLAAISRTDYAGKHMLFLSLASRLNQRQDEQAGGDRSFEPLHCGSLLENLFNLVQSVFVDIDDWLVQMENGRARYPLKEFLEKQVGQTIAPLLWRFLTLRAIASRRYKRVEAPDYPLFENFHSIWRTQFNKESGKLPDDADAIQLLQQLYHPLFGIYVQTIDHAGVAFKNLKEKLKAPPDTALLTAFAQLMEVQQQQLNKITQRHLDFYYLNILEQSIKPACADQAYLCVNVKQNVQEFLLPAGTQFNAGLDAQQQTLIYATTQPYLLNKAKLEHVKTLCYAPTSAPKAKSVKKLWLNRIETPAELKKDPQGQLLSWPLLGETAGAALKQGFAFASPLLALQNGERTLSICLEWAEGQQVPDDYFNDSEVYLSTQNGWFLVKKNHNLYKRDESGWYFKNNTFEIKLGVTEPPIVRLTENPDGYACRWPLFKLVLGDKVDLAAPPALKSVTITTEVRESGAFELYNDFGKLEEHNGCLPFGPIPGQGANFYLGSAEVFAKPLIKLELHVKWDNLPPFMQDYYRQYNDFLLEYNLDVLCRFMAALASDQKQSVATALSGILLDNSGKPITIKAKDLSTCKNILMEAIPRQYPPASVQSLLNAVADKLKGDNPLSAFQLPDADLFDNQCFKVSFSIWRQTQAQNIAAENTLDEAASRTQGVLEEPGLVLLFVETPIPSTQPPAPPQNIEAPKKPRYALKFLGFEKKAAAENTPPHAAAPGVAATEHSQSAQPLASASVFHIDPSGLRLIKPVPDLLALPLTFSTGDKTGFLSMKLENPSLGFGNGLYAQVVMDVCQKNAVQMINRSDQFVPMPNVPYVPKITQLSVSYSAERCSYFSTPDEKHPFEFYHYDCFCAYPVFDDQGLSANLRQTPDLPGIDTTPVKLFASLGATACLYLCVTDLEPPCQLGLYFELSHFVEPKAYDKPSYLYFYYLADTDWNTLPVLSDDTRQLSCSGIMEVTIPKDIRANHPRMPKDASGDSYWLALATNNPPDDFARAVFLTTQAIKVKRLNLQGVPYLAAGQINSPVMPVQEIEAVNQPFASFNGLAQEESHAFYHRVSQRIKTKDRASSQSDFELMALKALPGLYYCKRISPKDLCSNPGEVRLGLVNGYDDPALPDAFEPVISRCDLDKIRQYFTARISPFVRLELFNLSHETVTVKTGLKFVSAVAINRTCQDISQQLKIYLSPWIESEQPQINIDEGLSSAEINGFLAGLPGVEKVCSLSLSTQFQHAENQFIVYPNSPDGLFVSADVHDISAVQA